jgi:hypothetical protein
MARVGEQEGQEEHQVCRARRRGAREEEEEEEELKHNKKTKTRKFVRIICNSWLVCARCHHLPLVSVFALSVALPTCG